MCCGRAAAGLQDSPGQTGQQPRGKPVLPAAVLVLAGRAPTGIIHHYQLITHSRQTAGQSVTDKQSLRSLASHLRTISLCPLAAATWIGVISASSALFTPTSPEFTIPLAAAASPACQVHAHKGSVLYILQFNTKNEV